MLQNKFRKNSSSWTSGLSIDYDLNFSSSSGFCSSSTDPKSLHSTFYVYPVQSNFFLFNVKQNTRKNPVVGRLLPEFIFEVHGVLNLCYLAPLTWHIEYVILLWGCHGLWVLFPKNRVRKSSDHTILDGNVFSYNMCGLQVLNIQLCPVWFWYKRLNSLKVLSCHLF